MKGFSGEILRVLEMGKNAVLLLFDLINKRRTAPQEIILHPRLVIRNSCRRMA